MVEVTLILKLDDPNKAAVAFWDGVTFTDDGRAREKWVWLPRSQISWEPIPGAIRGGTVEVTMPEWLAMDKGLI